MDEKASLYSYQPYDKLFRISENSIPDQTQEVVLEPDPLPFNATKTLFHGFSLHDAVNDMSDSDILNDEEWVHQVRAIQLELRRRGFSRSEIIQLRVECSAKVPSIRVPYDPFMIYAARLENEAWLGCNLTKLKRNALVERQVYCKRMIRAKKQRSRRQRKRKSSSS